MQTTFQKLVRQLKKKYKCSQRDIAYMLGIRETTISNCLHKKARCTGEKFVDDLERLVAHLEGKKSSDRQVEQYDAYEQDTYESQHEEVGIEQEQLPIPSSPTALPVQSFVPEYELGTVFACPNCYSQNGLQQEATEACLCIHCGFKYTLKEDTQTKVRQQEVIPTYKRGTWMTCHKCGYKQEAMRRGKCWKCGSKYQVEL